jgi:hypothetical protein
MLKKVLEKNNLANDVEEIESLPLMQRRRILGYAIPLINGPLVLYNFYTLLIHFREGMTLGDAQFVEDLFVIISALIISLVVPLIFPVYKSQYKMGKNGVILSRFLRSQIRIPFKEIDRVEIFIRETPKISDDAKEYALDSSSNLRKSGFKFKDFTNNEDIIMNLFSGQNIYMISPAKPKTILKKLKRRNKKLTAKIVELNERGKKIQELGK